MSFWKDLGTFFWRDDKGAISPTRFFSNMAQWVLLIEFVWGVHHGSQLPFMYWAIPCIITGNRSLIYFVDKVYRKKDE